MRVEADIENKRLLIKYDNDIEYQQTSLWFKRKIRNARFRAKGRWDGTIDFLTRWNELPIGLWNELRKMCERFKFPLNTKEIISQIATKVNKDELYFVANKYVTDENTHMRPMQVEAVYKSLYWRYAVLDLATNSGKTVIVYMYISYLLYKSLSKKILIICPDADLVMQMNDNFLTYGGFLKQARVKMIHGKVKNKDIEGYNIVIGTFLSLKNRGDDFFKDFDTMIVDEAHKAQSKSIRDIEKSCVNLKRRLGMTGSFIDDKSADHYAVLCATGPVVMVVTKKDLEDLGYSAIMNVHIVILEYMTDQEKKEMIAIKDRVETGVAKYDVEMAYIRDNQTRIKLISNFISQLEGNTLVFFNDVKYSYGKKIASTIRKICEMKGLNKMVYYIDGDVDNDTRSKIKMEMEKGDNKILVASYGTYSTGKSITNLKNIVIAESIKSEIILNQSMGRGARKGGEKIVCDWYDFADDTRYNEEGYEHKSYSMSHLSDRKKLYRKWGFKYDEQRLVYNHKGLL